MDKQGIKPTTNHLLITWKEYNTYLCHMCGKTLGSMDTPKRHLNCHTDETYKCPMCKYTSPRMDAIRRHSPRPKTDKEPSWATMALETKPYQANPSSVNSNLYQQTMPKNKEAFIYINRCFSFCLVTFLKMNLVKFSHKTEKYFSRRQVFASFPTWFPQVRRKF